MFDFFSISISESEGLFASIGIIAAYQLYLHLSLRKDPNYTLQAANHAARRRWISYIMANGGKDILAVQTLRNSTMAATFLASTAILLVIGVLNLSQNLHQVGDLMHHIKPDIQIDQHLLMLKVLLLLVDLFCSFFCFTLAIRTYNHVGFLVNSSFGESSMATPEFVSTILNRGGTYYSLGMRSYYLAIPLIFWFFGPGFMLMASSILVFLLFHVDRAPAHRQESPSLAGFDGQSSHKPVSMGKI